MEARRFSVKTGCSSANNPAFCLPQMPDLQRRLRQDQICLQNDQVVAWNGCQT